MSQELQALKMQLSSLSDKQKAKNVQNQFNKQFLTALEKAAISGEIKLAQELLNAGAEMNNEVIMNYPLLIIVKNSRKYHPQLLNFLLSNGAMAELHRYDEVIYLSDSDSLTSEMIKIKKHLRAIKGLFCFARGRLLVNESQEILQELENVMTQGIDPVDYYISRGADLNQRAQEMPVGISLIADFTLNSPLHLACHYQNMMGLSGILDYLETLPLSQQIKILSAQNRYGATPLDLAFDDYPEGKKEITALLKTMIYHTVLEPLEEFLPPPMVGLVSDYYNGSNGFNNENSRPDILSLLPVANHDEGVNWMFTLIPRTWKLRKRELDKINETGKDLKELEEFSLPLDLDPMTDDSLSFHSSQNHINAGSNESFTVLRQLQQLQPMPMMVSVQMSDDQQQQVQQRDQNQHMQRVLQSQQVQTQSSQQLPQASMPSFSNASLQQASVTHAPLASPVTFSANSPAAMQTHRASNKRDATQNAENLAITLPNAKKQRTSKT